MLLNEWSELTLDIVFYYGVIALLRQVWAWHDGCYRPFFPALWKRMEIKSHLALSEEEIFFFSRSGASLEQDGVMHIQSLLCVCVAMVKKSDFYSENQEFEAWNHCQVHSKEGMDVMLPCVIQRNTNERDTGSSYWHLSPSIVRKGRKCLVQSMGHQLLQHPSCHITTSSRPKL